MDHTWIAPNEIDDLLNPNYYREIYLDATRKVLIDGQRRTLATISNKIADGPFGSHLKTDEYLSIGIPLFRVSDVQNLSLNLTDIVYISPEKQKQLSRSKVLAGDILITKAGRIGSSAVVPRTIAEANITSHLALIRPKSGIDEYYVAAFLESKYGRLLSERSSHKSTRPELTKTEVEKIPVYLPNPKIQAYIGDKVRLAEMCREEANRLWDEAKQLLANTIGLPLSAEAYQSYNLNEIQSDNYQAVNKTPVICWVHQSIVDDRLGAQFFHPRRENIILKLRDTCELIELSEVAVRVTKRISAEKAAHLGYVGLSEIDSANGFFEPIPMEKAETVGVSSYFGSGDILFSKLRPYLNKVTICPDHIKEACGSTELLVYRAKRNVRPYYLFFILKSSLGLFQIIDLTTGSTLPRVDPEIIDDLLIPLLTEQIQEEIDRKVRKTFYLLHTARNLINQSQSDVEALIENRLPVDQILAGILRSPNFDEILTKCSLE